MKYRVIVEETQSYEVYVETDTEEEAAEIAEDIYGSDGEVIHTNIEAVDIEEEEE